jgi:hypothetical protein
MKTSLPTWCFLAAWLTSIHAQDSVPAVSGVLLPGQLDGVTLWSAQTSAAKIRPEQPPPTQPGNAI